MEIIKEERSIACPISRKEMVKHLKNILCGHVYNRHSTLSLCKQSPICRCPMVSCPSKRALVRSNLLQEDKRAIPMKRSK